MPITMPTVLLSPGILQTVNLLSPSAPQALKVSNKSPYDVQYSGFGVVGSDWIPSGTEYMLYASIQSAGELNLTAFNNANVSPAAPGAVLVSEYLFGESLPIGHWPVSIPFQTVNASTNVTTAQHVKDTVDPPLTPVISMQPTDVAGNNLTVLIDNSGNATFKSDNAGTLTTLLQLIAGASPAVKLAAATIVTEILGSLRVDGGIISVPASTNLSLQAPSGQQITLQLPAGTSRMHVDINGLAVDNGGSLFFSGGGAIKGMSHGASTTVAAPSTKVIAHGLPAFPFWADIVINSSSSTTTYSVTWDATNITVLAFNGGLAFTWIAIA